MTYPKIRENETDYSVTLFNNYSDLYLQFEINPGAVTVAYPPSLELLHVLPQVVIHFRQSVQQGL